MGKDEVHTLPVVSCPVEECSEKLIAPGKKIGSLSSCEIHGLMVLTIKGWKPLVVEPDTDDKKVGMACATV